MTEKLTELFQSFWTEGAIPQELKDASISTRKMAIGRLAITTEESP